MLLCLLGALFIVDHAVAVDIESPEDPLERGARLLTDGDEFSTCWCCHNCRHVCACTFDRAHLNYAGHLALQLQQALPRTLLRLGLQLLQVRRATCGTRTDERARARVAYVGLL